MKLLIILALAEIISAYSDGAPDCEYPSIGSMGAGTATTGNYSISFYEFNTSVPITKITPNTDISVFISGTTNYKGFLIHSSSQGTIFENFAGSFSLVAGDHRLQTQCGATAGVTQRRVRAQNPRNSDGFTWRSPSATGNYTFFAVVVVSRTEWYGDQGKISAVLEVSGTAPSYNSTTTHSTVSTSTATMTTATTTTTPTPTPGGNEATLEHPSVWLFFVSVLALLIA